MKIAIVQKVISLYRVAFFYALAQNYPLTLYTYAPPAASDAKTIEGIEVKRIRSISFKGLLYTFITPLLFDQNDLLILQLNKGHLSTWLLLLTKWLHRKQIYLWGQGISVKRYLKEERQPDKWLKMMISLADGVWIYMQKEERQWQQIFPSKKMVALNNTLSGITGMITYEPKESIICLKDKYGIKEKRIVIFCARFTNCYRRTDLLLKTIEKTDSDSFGFIIIGEGQYKPNFTHYSNVYDFGAVYDPLIKRELFAIADLYFQPGWVGLSIVEAMAYGKPVCTFKRTADTLQCVEYAYIEDNYNGMIFSNIDDCIRRITETDDDTIKWMGNNAKNYVKNNLTIEQMVSNALSII